MGMALGLLMGILLYGRAAKLFAIIGVDACLWLTFTGWEFIIMHACSWRLSIEDYKLKMGPYLWKNWADLDWFGSAGVQI